MKKRVLLGMSGGIDSSISALLLLEQGYEVIGATMSFWDNRIAFSDWPRHGCYGPHERENIAAAEQICRQNGIPHHIISLHTEFSQCVLSYFCSTYLDGKTPNPCVRCNQQIKFGFFIQKAREQGLEFDLFATGHYARVKNDPASGRWQLLRAADPLKDQSYFLSYLSQEQLSQTIFPLGGMTKGEVRKLSADKGLGHLQDKDESQDFLNEEVYNLVFPQEVFRPGDIVDPEGKVLGRHRGLLHFTIGQRKHLGISGMPEPYYVTAIDAAENRIVVGPQSLLYADKLVAERVNWVSIPGLESELRAETKIRLGHEAAPCVLRPLENGQVEVVFDEPQLSITPGQVAVFHAGEVILGGGTIV
ncbi:MAG: tRNA 2-thiouridine(34) synthase MnmA [Candidatus Syntrophosphaera sp.]|nr:tRNA 2-thiouridine(34) synthase MnmA [Candidatus Syntrophosphaera sp.]